MSVINDIIDFTRDTCNIPTLYHNIGGLNVLLDEVDNANFKDQPFALMTIPEEGNLSINNRECYEEYLLNVSFCVNGVGVDFDAEQVEKVYISKLKEMAFVWVAMILKYFQGSIHIEPTRCGREFLKLDAILVGFSVTLRIREVVNFSNCDITNKQID